MPDYDPVPSQRGGAPRPPKKKKKKGSGLFGRIVRRFFLVLFTVIALILVAAVFYSFAINLFGETPSVELADINEAAQLITAAADEDANIIFGAGIDESLGDTMRITVIATGFDEAQQAANAAAVQNTQTANGAPQPLNEVQGEQGQDEMDKSFDEILRIFNKDKF